MSNLLPIKEKKSILSMYRMRFLSVVFFASMGFFVIATVLLFPALFALKSDENLLIAKRDTLNSNETTQITATLATTISDINKRLNVFPDSVTPSPVIAPFIDPVLKLKTDAVHITDFQYSTADKGKTIIQISGTTNSRADLLDFTDALKATSNFTNVTVPIESFIKNSNVTFTISGGLVAPK